MVVVTVAKLPVGVTRPMVVYGFLVTHDAGGGCMENAVLHPASSGVGEELWAEAPISGKARSHSSRIAANVRALSRRSCSLRGLARLDYLKMGGCHSRQ